MNAPLAKCAFLLGLALVRCLIDNELVDPKHINYKLIFSFNRPCRCTFVGIDADKKCPANNDVDVKFPNPDDCGETFYHCSHGVAYLMQCARAHHGKLRFNCKIDQCDYPYNVPCSGPCFEGGIRTTTTRTTTKKTTTTKPATKTTTVTTSTTTTRKPTTTTKTTTTTTKPPTSTTIQSTSQSTTTTLTKPTTSRPLNCPQAEIRPCKCPPSEDNLVITCDGAEVTDQTLRKLQHLNEFKYRSLLVRNTNVGAIQEFVTVNATFEEIKLISNKKLKKVNVKAFYPSRRVTNKLTVIDSPLLDKEWVNLFKYMETVKELTIEHTGISSLPTSSVSFGQNGLYLEVINMNHNKISRLMTRSLNGLFNLRSASFQNNTIAKGLEQDNIFGLSKTNKNQAVIISLANNRVDNSFTSHTFDNSEAVEVDLDLENNRMVGLARNHFEDFIYSHPNIVIRLKGNPFDCACDMKWVYDLRNQPEQRKKFRDVICVEQDLEIFEIEEAYWETLPCARS